MLIYHILFKGTKEVPILMNLLRKIILKEWITGGGYFVQLLLEQFLWSFYIHRNRILKNALCSYQIFMLVKDFLKNVYTRSIKVCLFKKVCLFFWEMIFYIILSKTMHRETIFTISIVYLFIYVCMYVCMWLAWNNSYRPCNSWARSEMAFAIQPAALSPMA